MALRGWMRAAIQQDAWCAVVQPRTRQTAPPGKPARSTKTLQIESMEPNNAYKAGDNGNGIAELK
jgi:hypothetical protein